MIYCLDFVRVNSAVWINASAGSELQPPPPLLPLTPEAPSPPSLSSLIPEVPLIVIERLFTALAVPYMAVTVKSNFPETVGVPEILPDESRTSPVGRFPV